MNWHTLSIPEAFEKLDTGPQGLKDREAKERILKYGRNVLKEAKRESILRLFLAQFKDVMILILLAAAIVSGIIGDLTDTVVILIIVFLNAVIGFLQEYKAEKAILALKKMVLAQVRVFRDGNITWLNAPELVPGDVILLEAGNAVAADIRIINSYNLKIEEAALTGESNAVNKFSHKLEIQDLPLGDKKNMAFNGTYVVSGRGLVIATGMKTELGHIAEMLQEEESLSPLQQRMAEFGKKLSVVVLLLCVLFFITGWLRGETLTKMVLTTISLAVAAIPEALPTAITISLALATKRMVRFKTLIRKLPAVETLGSVSYICTDKTGTLTKNKMKVENVFVKGQLYEMEELSLMKQDEEVKLLLSAFALNNDTVEDKEKNIKGDSTEIALMEVARDYNVQKDNWPRLAEIAFSPETKLMTTFHRYNERIISFVKGAPEVLLQKCVNINLPEMHNQINTMADKGQRILGFAYRYWDKLPMETDTQVHADELTFLGLTGMIDPPRDEVFPAVEQCKTAGIVPVMITGDHLNTAKAIAERIGILSREGIIVSGKELAELDDAAFLAKVERIRVYARVSPEQKFRIVKTLQEKGHYVAMTGDGVNDAPSLKRADIGIAMGISGSDVSKEAADLILLDDNFSTIIKTVKEGRRIYDNILKLIKYLMTTNSSELLTLLLGSAMGLPVALLPIHILWINLVSDGMPAISISFEKAEKDIMKRPPRPPGESVFANGRGWHMLWVGLLMTAVALMMQQWAIKNGHPWQTVVFNVLCLSQMGHVLAVRSEKYSLFSIGMFSNRLLIWSVIIVLLFQFLITYSPLLQPIFHTSSLSLGVFIQVGAASSIVFFAVEIEKAIFKKRRNVYWN